MENTGNIFAKPPASPSHHYALLLQKKELSNQNFKEQFSNTMPSPVHLYSSMGLAKGHRKAVSGQRSSPDPQPLEAFTEPVRKITDENLGIINRNSENEWLRSQLELERKNNFKLQIHIQELEAELKTEKEKVALMMQKISDP
ncbi:hypothetical protein SteCoe_18666 [Stentor coeruleus]|uniref:Uncharacterized protein n=1 Tax=Stentor coeruleus TaxID=5963 RepID=A0A1R2BVW1_9CILI|nr:hypothetical protein SteCoe_18666 [Stentor coeruleus]